MGDFCNADTCYQGFVRTPDGTFTVINANAGIPAGINPAGAITGYAVDGVWRLSAESRRHLHHVQSAGVSRHRALAINPAGAITGYYCEADWCAHGYLRAPDGTITTFDPPGSTFTFSQCNQPGWRHHRSF